MKKPDNVKRAKTFIDRMDYFDLVDTKNYIETILLKKYADRYNPNEGLIDPKSFKITIPPEIKMQFEAHESEIRDAIKNMKEIFKEYDEVMRMVTFPEYDCEHCGGKNLRYDPNEKIFECKDCGKITGDDK